MEEENEKSRRKGEGMTSQSCREAWVILRLEAPNSPYGHLANTVKQNMAELDQYIDSVKNM